MKSSTKRIFSILISAALLIAVIVIFIKLIEPAYSQIQELRSEIQARNIFLTDQNKAVAQVQDIVGQLKEQNLSQFQEQISLTLPLSENIPEALSQYQSIAQISGLTIQSVGLNYLAIKPAAVNSDLFKGLGVIRFKLQLLGSYEGMGAFLSAVENNVRLTDLVSFKISHASQNKQNLYLNDLVVDTYYQSN